VIVENLGVHHDLPCVYGQIGVIETPVELLIGHGLIGGVVVRSEVVISQGVGRGDTLLGVENQHPLEKLDGSRISVLELVLQRLSLALWQRLDKSQSVLAGNRVNDVIRRGAEQLRNYRELVDVILSREERLALEHLSKDAASTPNVNLNVVLLPREHNLRCAVISRRDIAGHLGVLYAGKAEITDLEITVLVDEDVAGLEVAMDDSGRVYVFQTTHNLVEEVLDELLLERPRSEQSVQVGAEKLSDEVDVLEGRNEDVAERNDILVSKVLEELEFTVCALGQDGGTEGLHDLLDSDILVCQLIAGGANEAKGSHSHRLQVRVPRGDLKGCSEDLGTDEFGHCEGVWCSTEGTTTLIYWMAR